MEKKYLPVIAVLGFFILLLAVGILIYKDFGVPTDDPAQAQLAALNYRYIFKGDQTLLTAQVRYLSYHGVIIELPLLWVETRVGASQSENARHLALFFAFLASLVVFYFLSCRLFRNRWWGLLSSILLASSPRIFADAFYNSKDIPFMEMFIFSAWTLLLLVDALKNMNSFRVASAFLGLHALTSALLIDTRIAGVTIVPLSLILFVIVGMSSPRYWKRNLAVAFGYLVLTSGLIVLFWPVLWHDPLGEFLNAFNQMSTYDVYGKAVLYLGKFYAAGELPWHYLPVWICISTPLVVLAGLLPGFLNWLHSTAEAIGRGSKDNMKGFIIAVSERETRDWLVVIGWLAIPITAVYWFRSVLYGAWRQMFFIYPPLVLISTRGFYALYGWIKQHTRRPIAAIGPLLLILAVGLAEPVGFIIRYHPNENVYFNQLVGDPATLRQRFELDYWGLSYKQAIDYILTNDPDEKISIFVADTPGLDYIYTALSSQQKSRLVILDNPDNGARYFVGDFSFHPADYYPLSKEIYSVFVRGVKIIAVYKLR